MADSENYIGVREHHEAVQALKDEQARQREKTAGLEMALLHQMNGMQRMLEDIRASLQRPTQVDHSALATHRAIETLPQAIAEALKARGGNQSPVLIAFALLGAVALGAFGMQL